MCVLCYACTGTILLPFRRYTSTYFQCAILADVSVIYKSIPREVVKPAVSDTLESAGIEGTLNVV